MEKYIAEGKVVGTGEKISIPIYLKHSLALNYIKELKDGAVIAARRRSDGEELEITSLEKKDD